jgi:hypothetical protein
MMRTLILACLLASPALAHVRLLNPSTGAPLRWGQPGSVSVIYQIAGCSDLDPLSHLPALRGAARNWNGVEETAFQLVENTVPAQMARTDWGSDSLHMVYFDEDGSSGYFPVGSGLVALTLVWFSGGGSITDADILFNARDHQFSVRGDAYRFDVQDIATHELGHLAGLDHSGVAGATMYPYVYPAETLHRSLSADERHALRSMYPLEPGARLEGRLTRSGGSVVKGAHVVARDSGGEPVAACLSDNSGEWTLQGLHAGNYQIYATPLDQPVGAINLGPGRTVHTNFSTTSLGEVTLGAEQSLDIGTRMVAPDLPILLGRSMEQFPKRITRGQLQTITIYGSGLSPDCSIQSSDPSVPVTPLAWNGSHVQLLVDARLAVRDGHFDLTVTQGGLSHTLVGGLELAPSDPSVLAVDPDEANHAGGDFVTITGSGFRSGLRVVIGEQEYAEGEAGGVELLSATSLRLRLKPTQVAVHDVVVIDSSGVEGRLPAALEVRALLRVDSLFPAAGFAGGGTELTVRGANFDPAVRVRIAGVEQTQVVRENSGLLRVMTLAGSVGSQKLEVENPEQESAEVSFEYTAHPDPALLAVSPSSGPSAGGTTVFLYGENFRPGSVVRFGVDPLSGGGGTEAVAAIVRENGLLEVVTPSHGSGTQAVLVTDPQTGQSALLSGGFTYHGSGSGGGGCSVVPYTPPAGPGANLSAGLGWLLALGALLWQQRRVRRTA